MKATFTDLPVVAPDEDPDEALVPLEHAVTTDRMAVMPSPVASAWRNRERVEATEEAIYNSLFRATTVTGIDGHRSEALPIERTLEILKRNGALQGK